MDLVRLRSECSSLENLPTLLGRYPQLSEVTILRHLIMCKGSIRDTACHIENMLLWRRQTFPLAELHFVDRSLSGALYLNGYDQEGHPMMVFQYQYWDPNSHQLDELVRWGIYIIEVAIARIPKHLNQICCLYNASHSDKQPNLAFLRKFMEIIQDYYPCYFHRVYVCPITTIVISLWSIVKTFIPSRTKHIVMLLKDVSALREVIPDEYIPENMGGSSMYVADARDYVCPFRDNYSLCEDEKRTKMMEDTEAQNTIDPVLDDIYQDDRPMGLGLDRICEPSVSMYYIPRMGKK